MNGFRVPKSVLKTGLKHAPLVVYLYLLSIGRKEIIITYAQLANKLSLSQKTAFNAVERLLERGLIVREYKTVNGKIVATRLIIAELPSEPWVWVERKLFTLNLSSSELNVYLYIKCCANHQAGRAWPAISEIHEDTGLAKATVRKAIQSLCANSLLSMKRQTLECGRPGRNHYWFKNIAEREAVLTVLRKKKTHTHKLRRSLTIEIRVHIRCMRSSAPILIKY